APPLVPVVQPGGGFLDLCPDPAALPGWLTEGDIGVFAAEFAAAGFTGPLNWYRNLDRNWELTAPWHHAPVMVPALYVAGDRDFVLSQQGPDELVAGCARWCRGCSTPSCSPAGVAGPSRRGPGRSAGP